MTTSSDSFDSIDGTGSDAGSRRRIRESLDESLLVEAAAGTGKTTALVGRLVAVLSRGIPARGPGASGVEGVAAVTFTRKAAGELKLRLRQELDRARGRATTDTARANLEDAIARLEEARIGTIHSFCAEILRERPVEALVDPAFEEVADDEAPRIYDRAFDDWIQRRLQEMPEGLRRALSRLAGRRDQDSPLDRLREAGWKLVDWRDFSTPWRREAFDREAEINRLATQILELGEICVAGPGPADYLRRALEPVELLATWIVRAEAVAPRDHDGLEARFLNLLRDLVKDKRRGYGKSFGEASREAVLDARTHLIGELESFERAANADLAALLKEELSEVIELYEERKRRAGKLDFGDLLIKVRDLVRDRADVRAYLQERFSHIFVDEFQDTDPLQAEILLLLAADDPTVSDWHLARPKPGKLFLVGDPKQSIYRFRRADVVLYQGIRERLGAVGVVALPLTRSFRSVRSLQVVVNTSFAPLMTGDRVNGQPDYVALEEVAADRGDQPTVIALPAPRPYGKYGSRITHWAVDECLPTTVTSWVDWLLNESGWTVRDPEGGEQRIPVQPQHVCLLFRRFMSWKLDVTRDYVRGLEARGIPHLLVGARSFHRREEVETLRAALTAIEWPDDELSVFATLKGSLFAVPDGLLLRFRTEVGPLHPFRPLPADLDADFAMIREALERIAHHHRKRNWVPLVETVTGLIEFTRAHAGFALRPAGNQVLANVQRVCELARAYELGGGISFRGFVERLNAEAEKSQTSEAPVPEEGAEGVRMMTVHAAKGLEYPVVVLCDLTAKLAAENPDRFVDPSGRLCATRIMGCAPWELIDNEELEGGRDEAEGVRIAYVAATRARDLLVVPAVGDDKFDGWLSPLNAAIYPRREEWRNPKQAPAGCPPFGDASVLGRPRDFDGLPERSIKPGSHRPEVGEHTVVWWDPAALKLDVQPNFGLRESQILREDEHDRTAASDGLAAYAGWRDERARGIAEGSRMEHSVILATDAQVLPLGVKIKVTVEEVGSKGTRPSGPRFGTLVHTVLRDVEFGAAAAAVRELAVLHGKLLNATELEVAAAAAAVERALVHPLMRRASAATRMHREAPVVLDLGGGRLFEGTIDLAFLEGDTWCVVDFKTDVELAGKQADYERQVGWYVHALMETTGRKGRGVLLRV